MNKLTLVDYGSRAIQNKIQLLAPLEFTKWLLNPPLKLFTKTIINIPLIIKCILINIFLNIYRSGVPFSLGFASLNNQNRCYTYVKPFPCIETFDTKLNNNGVLVNVIDLVMGEDGLIWVLDSGISETLNDRFLIEGEPKVVGIDETTGKVNYSSNLFSIILFDEMKIRKSKENATCSF